MNGFGKQILRKRRVNPLAGMISFCAAALTRNQRIPLRTSEDIRILIVALLVALVLAANDVTRGGFSGALMSYGYWICRILIESTIFLGFLYTLEKYSSVATRRWIVYATAIASSLLLFTLAITSFDLILGLPELGLNEAAQPSSSRFQAFVLEVIYLLDNHLALCLLLLITREFSRHSVGDVSAQPQAVADQNTEPDSSTFLATLNPPLQGSVHWVEAQEHYIRIATQSESRMVLYRFSDAIRELPASRGMQVHRSHWVAYAAVTELKKEGQNLKLVLANGATVPVSRSFRTKVEDYFTDLVVQSS